MSGYTKLFHSLLASTVWREPHTVRLVWITMLAMADRDGVVESSVPGLADFARVTVDECRHALERLLAPDPDSRSKDEDGRRIRAVDGGWQLVNHDKYRRRMTADDRREYQRQKQQQYRAKRRTTAEMSPSSQQTLRNVSNVSQNPYIAEAEAEAEAEAKAEATAEKAALARRPSPRPKSYGRIDLHPWQAHAIIQMLGPHADGFDLDQWLLDLSQRATDAGLVLTREQRWPWIQSELVTECQRRGLRIAAPAAEPTMSKRTQGIMATVAKLAQGESER